MRSMPERCAPTMSTPSYQRSSPARSARGNATTRSSSSIRPAWPCRTSPRRPSSTSALSQPVAEHLSSSARSKPRCCRNPQSCLSQSKEKTEEPPLFKVLLHNDDYTTMDFVVHVLEAVFNVPEDQAIQIMLNVHVKGIGVAGV